MSKNKSREVTLSLLPKEAADDDTILKLLKKQQELQDMDVRSFKIIRKSIDARKKPVKVNLRLIVSETDEIEFSYPQRKYFILPKDSQQIVIVGAGPAGLFAGLKAIELGLKPIILERGKDVDNRRKDLARISREEKIDPNSNFCFGEGGAGAFSDGKLYTRSKKRGNVTEVLELLHQFGAKEDILINSHPHIGSDRLPAIIKNIRNKIIECGGEVRFNTTVNSVIIDDKKVKGIITETGEQISGPVFLATGHSARDIYEMLNSEGVRLEAKGIAIGVRLEHPQSLIDRMQYHSENGRGSYLPPAEYSFVNQANGRGVYSFCMCPGGVIVPAVSDSGQIVVNGMSASARSGRWANSGYVVELHPGDIPGFKSHGSLEMLRLQQFLENQFSKESKGSLNAPAQLIKDFINNKDSKLLPSTSYAPGIHPARLDKMFPPEISSRLKIGLGEIGKKCGDFIEKDGVMIGLESRTSSPVRIPRDPVNLEHIEIENLYPVGEGAGYAGGIISSAIDGMNAIERFYSKLKNNGQHS